MSETRTLLQCIEDPQPGDILMRGTVGCKDYAIRRITMRSAVHVSYVNSGKRHNKHVTTVKCWKTWANRMPKAVIPSAKEAAQLPPKPPDWNAP